MDWLSFALGFLAFPIAGATGIGLYHLARRFLSQDNYSALAVSQRSSTLSFSSRLIGEIGEEGEEGEEGDESPAAKAS